MCFVIKAENRNGDAFEMNFDSSHDAHVAVKAIEKANETLSRDCKFYGHIQGSKSITDKDSWLVLIF